MPISTSRHWPPYRLSNSLTKQGPLPSPRGVALRVDDPQTSRYYHVLIHDG